MRNLGNLGLVVGVLVILIIGGGIALAMFFSIWIIAAILRLLKIQRPLTVKELFNL